jgi:hypothetical protein
VPGRELVQRPFGRLIKDRKLHGYQGDRFWCMDTFKEQQQLTDLYNSGHAPLGGLEGRPGRGPSSMMLPLVPRQPERGGYEILCLGAHRDDLEIGCGGTMLRPLRELPIERVTWGVLSGDEDRAREARRWARRLLGGHAGVRLIQATVRDGFFPYTAVSIKECSSSSSETLSRTWS